MLVGICSLRAQVLAGRKTTGTIRGDIWVNGHEKVQDTFKRVCGYVEQFGALPPSTPVCVPSRMMHLLPDLDEALQCEVM